MPRTAEEWLGVYIERGAFARHDGRADHPHMELTSRDGSVRHSNAYFNSDFVMQDSVLFDEACFDLVANMIRHGFDINLIDRVVGPAYGAIELSHDLSRHIALARKRPCLSAWAEPKDGALRILRRSIVPGEQVLIVDDVGTTFGSIGLTSDAVESAGGIVLPMTAVLVNRSGLSMVKGKHVVSLFDHPEQTWPAGNCPLCDLGSEALRPKGDNWAKFIGQH
jgi:orotate phosphoribosyltransferase